MIELKYNDARFLSAYGIRAQLPPSENKEFVFCGRSNVGKSTLINKVFTRKNLARTSSTPGKTATINFYRSDTNTDENIDFVDLPGYGYAKASKDEQRRLSELLDGYFSRKRRIQCVFLLIDSRRILDLEKSNNDDRIMSEYLTEKDVPFFAVLTKSDKLNQSERKKAVEYLNEKFPHIAADMIWFSALKGDGTGGGLNEGVGDIRSVIEEIINNEKWETGGDVQSD